MRSVDGTRARIAQFSILHFQFSILHKKEPETLVSGSFILLQLKRSGIELIIFAVFRDQLFMVAALDDMTELQHHNNVCVLNRGQAVRDDEHWYVRT